MKKVRWGVIGAGGIADRRTLPGMMLSEEAELIAVMEINDELAENLRVKYGAKRAYTDHKALLADPEVDVVYIASPVNCHKEQAIDAARAKKDILLEKPICLDIADAEEVLRVCEEEGVKIATGFLMRFHAINAKIRELVQSGAIGQVVSCRAQFTCWYPDIPGAWRQVKALSGGGALMDLGVHCIDLLQYIVGSKAKRVASFSRTNTFNYEVEDQASLMMELENGAFAYVESNFNVPDAVPSKLEIFGTGGSIVAYGTLSQVEGGTIDVIAADSTAGYDAQQTRDEVKKLDVNVEFGNMYTKELDSFGRSHRDGAPVEVPAADAVWAQRIIKAAYESQETDKIITL
ncbi:MAG: Gfo/Idh/MocA family oxidoreductase [Oscillospiraceae bacterium]|nr:Gfo/Idh/MocA family oxidoreductase [Oscillospiraceae bacterium]